MLRCSECNKPVRPVVALDIDGTLGDYHGHFLRFAAEYLDVPFFMWRNYDGSVDLATHMGLTKEVYRQVKLAYRQGGMKRTMPPMPGFKDLLLALEHCNAEIWITTTRPYLRLDNVDPDTREWLRRWQVPHNGLIYDKFKYNVLADIVGKERFVAALDDLPDQLDAATAQGALAIQTWTPYNAGTRRAPGAATLRQAAGMLLRAVDTWYMDKEGHAHD